MRCATAGPGRLRFACAASTRTSRAKKATPPAVVRTRSSGIDQTRLQKMSRQPRAGICPGALHPRGHLVVHPLRDAAPVLRRHAVVLRHRSPHPRRSAPGRGRVPREDGVAATEPAQGWPSARRVAGIGPPTCRMRAVAGGMTTPHERTIGRRLPCRGHGARATRPEEAARRLGCAPEAAEDGPEPHPRTSEAIRWRGPRQTKEKGRRDARVPARERAPSPRPKRRRGAGRR